MNNSHHLKTSLEAENITDVHISTKNIINLNLEEVSTLYKTNPTYDFNPTKCIGNKV